MIGRYMGVVLKVLVKEGPLGIHFLQKGILTKEGTYIMVILGTCILNNYHMRYFLLKNDIQGIQDHDIGSYLGFYIC